MQHQRQRLHHPPRSSGPSSIGISDSAFAAAAFLFSFGNVTAQFQVQPHRLQRNFSSAIWPHAFEQISQSLSWENLTPADQLPPCQLQHSSQRRFSL